MNSSEKRINELKLRLTDSEMKALVAESIITDRTVTDCGHHLISRCLFGVVNRMPDCNNSINQSNRDE